jgi:hypothetical protein
MKAMLTIKRPTGQPFIESALGWVVDTRGGSEIIWKNGGTGGYRTFIGYAPRTGVGVVARSNASTESGTDDIGLHLLDARFPSQIPEGSARESTVSTKVLESYVGHYELTPTVLFSVTREGEQLFVQITGQPRSAVYSKTEKDFFFKVVDAQISFQTDAHGQAVGLVLHQGGRDQSAKRISEADAKQFEDALGKRFKEQTAAPGSETATRRVLDQMQRKQVDYEQFSADFAVTARQNAGPVDGLIASLGTLRSLAFKGVGPGGDDIYELKFDNGTVDWRISLTADGKISGIGFRKLPRESALNSTMWDLLQVTWREVLKPLRSGHAR